MSDINEDVLKRLEAEAITADVSTEELTVAVQSDIQESEDQIEELQSTVSDRESEIEELQSSVEEKESELSEKETEIEELQEKMDEVAETYAEELAQHNEFMDSDMFLDKFEFEELQKMHSDLEESEPSARSGDPGAGFQNPEGAEGSSDPEEPQITEKEELAASSFKKRAAQTGKAYWNDIAEEIESSE